jgi:hypothetical protein
VLLLALQVAPTLASTTANCEKYRTDMLKRSESSGGSVSGPQWFSVAIRGHWVVW